MKVNFTVKMKPAAIKALTDAQIKAVGMVAEQLRHEIITAQVIPLDTGTLQNVSTYIDMEQIKQGNVSIVHDSPYAQRLYYNPQYDFQQTFNTHAKGLWWEDWLNGDNKDRAKRLYSEFYKRVAGVYVK